MFVAVFIYLWPLYHSDGDISLVLFGGNAAYIALRLVLWSPCLRTNCFLFTYVWCCVCFPVTSLPFWWRYVISFIATAAYLGLFNCSHPFRPPFFCCFAPGRFARFHVRPESFRITVATSPQAASPNNRFYKMFLSAITFVIDVDISL